VPGKNPTISLSHRFGHPQVTDFQSSARLTTYIKKWKNLPKNQLDKNYYAKINLSIKEQDRRFFLMLIASFLSLSVHN